MELETNAVEAGVGTIKVKPLLATAEDAKTSVPVAEAVGKPEVVANVSLASEDLDSLLSEAASDDTIEWEVLISELTPRAMLEWYFTPPVDVLLRICLLGVSFRASVEALSVVTGVTSSTIEVADDNVLDGLKAWTVVVVDEANVLIIEAVSELVI